VLRAFAEEACAVARDELAEPTHLREDDHFGFMALCFAYKQLTHAHSALMLLKQQQALDATVIARVMLEGTILLGWCALDPSSRALRWRAYSLVSDYRLLRRSDQESAEQSSAKLAELTERLKEHKELHTHAGRHATASDARDPYQRAWHVEDDGSRVELRRMAEELQDPAMKTVYDDLSQVVHWTPAGVAFDIKRSGEDASIGFNSDAMCARGYAVLFQALSQTHLMHRRHRSQDDAQKMQSLVDRYIAKLSAA